MSGITGLSRDIVIFMAISPCDGEERFFKSVKQRAMWYRLHMKKCLVCANAKHSQTVKLPSSQETAKNTEKEVIDGVKDVLNSCKHLIN
jgi:hypothetical protein